MIRRIFVRIDGHYIPWNDLDVDQKSKISKELNERAMNAAGYEKDKTA